MTTTTIRYRWVISWIYNGEVRAEEFEFRLPAEIRMIQLEAFGIKPTLHERTNEN